VLTRPCFLHEVDAATPTPPVCVKTRLWILSVRYVSPEPVLINHRATYTSKALEKQSCWAPPGRCPPCSKQYLPASRAPG